ncbi:FAD-dependent monooxygenase [Devosia sp. BSSL-BM10]|uniref:FAD-dependent monooxygenase n=1 Tax=Devosia litorisediminis TaxID=2829817 RepID=A0A942I5A7_9HYPH|nr:FAD-dependent monooxygenase [Devosia litorisediminis]MBS3848616.1 FAD-dependent monooxygenase [Devosia litorisediminis]
MSGFDADAIVVGGGLAGVAAAIAVAKAGLRTIHLAPSAPPDRRTSALMMPSVDYLRRAGLIETPAALGHALTQIRIIDATGRLIRAPETLFDAGEAGLEAFGWNFANRTLLERFHAVAASLKTLETRAVGAKALDRDAAGWTVTLSDAPPLRVPLVVGADGKKSLVRSAAGLRASERQFDQSALVCDLDLGRPIGGTSIEFHYPKGPFTLVPAGGNRANLVWIDDAAVLAEAQAGGTEALLAIFAEKSQRLFGTIAMATPSFVFPLSTLSVNRAGQDGVVLVGESAHAFPPIGAQGLNLGLRDVADLAAVLDGADRDQADWADQLSVDYARRRTTDLAQTGGVVDTLFRSLLADMVPAQALRAGGLWALKLAPNLRRQAFDVGMGRR